MEGGVRRTENQPREDRSDVDWTPEREELNIRLDGKEIKQVDGFMYLGGMVTEDGHSAAGVRRRTQARTNAWRKVEGVMLDRNNSKQLKGKALRTYVTPEWSDSSVDRTTTTEAARPRSRKAEITSNVLFLSAQLAKLRGD